MNQARFIPQVYFIIVPNTDKEIIISAKHIFDSELVRVGIQSIAR